MLDISVCETKLLSKMFRILMIMERFQGRIRSSFRGKKVFRSKSFSHLSLRRKKGKFDTEKALIVPSIIGKNLVYKEDRAGCCSRSAYLDKNAVKPGKWLIFYPTKF